LGTLDRMPIREQEGRLHGPGIFDMKSGIAVSMLAMRALGEAGGVRPPVSMLWTADEEVGSATSRGLIEETARACRAVLVLEPSLPGGAAKTSRKGVGEFDLVVHGVSAHAGLDPGKGASAVHELARQILALETLQDPSRGITVNAGVIAGGTRPNVIADRASATIDVRVQTMEDAERVERAIRGLQPTRASIRLEIAGGVERPPLERSPAVVRLYQQAREVAAALGRDLGEGAAGGGSDGNFTAALGVPTLDGLGPRGDGAHAVHEHVLVEDLAWRAAFLAGLVETLQ
jgi:glutamate carboxypeptidase